MKGATMLASGRPAAKRPEFPGVNTMRGNLKTALAGTYHSFDHAKYAARYLAEFAYRFNRRFHLAAMRPRLLRAAVVTKPQPLAVLRWSEAGTSSGNFLYKVARALWHQ
ncbi:MAG: transposase [Rhodoferax sp.]|nr:transposase [Rhodoferax sp.]